MYTHFYVHMSYAEKCIYVGFGLKDEKLLLYIMTAHFLHLLCENFS